VPVPVGGLANDTAVFLANTPSLDSSGDGASAGVRASGLGIHHRGSRTLLISQAPRPACKFPVNIAKPTARKHLGPVGMLQAGAPPPHRPPVVGAAPARTFHSLRARTSFPRAGPLAVRPAGVALAVDEQCHPIQLLMPIFTAPKTRAVVSASRTPGRPGAR
jgi:hypothetical protein